MTIQSTKLYSSIRARGISLKNDLAKKTWPFMRESENLRFYNALSLFLFC